MPRVLLFVLFAAFVVSVGAHSTLYPHVAKNQQVDLENPPAILSFHIHITYTVFHQSVIDEAMALREKTREAFKTYLGPDCDGRYDYGYLCMIADHDFNTTLEGGPFVSGEWSMFVPVPYYQLVVPWMFQHRGNFSLIVHPNTGYEYEDHTIWAMWAGEPWPLDLTIFSQGEQTNEFGQTRGDSGNPVCLTEGAVCGDTTFGPSTLCCFDLACRKAESFPNFSLHPFSLSEYSVYRCI